MAEEKRGPPRPKRWEEPYGQAPTDGEIEKVFGQAPFSLIDRDGFRGQFPPDEIIRFDGRIEKYSKGDIIVRQGDYGSSVFLVLSGKIRVVFDALGEARGDGRRNFFALMAQLWTNARQPEVRDVSLYEGDAGIKLGGDLDKARTFVKNLDDYLNDPKTIPLGEGIVFGEIAALTRTPRTASCLAEEDTVVLELRWQGLRDLRQGDKEFRNWIDSLYKERSQAQVLGDCDLFDHLDDETVAKIAEQSVYETYGGFEWSQAFKKSSAKGDTKDIISQEPTIAGEGHYPDGLLILKAGFARVSQKLDRGERTVGYLGKDEIFGLEELYHQWKTGDEVSLVRSIRAIGYVDVLRVPSVLLEEYVFPTLPGNLKPKTPQEALPDANLKVWQQKNKDAVLEQSLLDFFVDNRTINGTKTMLINLDRCVGCDDCVRACASTHNGNPRFVRHGPVENNIQVTNSCQHCVDPVCLIGCPTGAIGRSESDGRVMINDRVCIGCGTCANSCPYNNIRLVEIRNPDGGFIFDQDTGRPVVKATKCDLCYGQLGGPACERACPHDALTRMDMRDVDRLARWVER